MPHLIMFMGKPQGFSEHEPTLHKAAEAEVAKNYRVAAVDGLDSGKATKWENGKLFVQAIKTCWRFTGWEVWTVEELV